MYVTHPDALSCVHASIRLDTQSVAEWRAPEYFESFRECIVFLLHYFSHFSVPVNSLTT
jgi:hypothetical protein